jgi:hypothetical protein
LDSVWGGGGGSSNLLIIFWVGFGAGY